MTREALPNKRHGESFDVAHPPKQDHVRYRVQVNEFADGRLGEVFINARKPDSEHDAAAGDFAILLSLLLQHGVTPAEIGHALRRNPDGTRVTIAGVVADAIAAIDVGAEPAMIRRGA